MSNPEFECAFTFACVNKNAAFRLVDWLSSRGLNPVRVSHAVAVDITDVAVARELLKDITFTGWISDNEVYEANVQYVAAFNSWRARGGEE